MAIAHQLVFITRPEDAMCNRKAVLVTSGYGKSVSYDEEIFANTPFPASSNCYVNNSFLLHAKNFAPSIALMLAPTSFSFLCFVFTKNRARAPHCWQDSRAVLLKCPVT